MQGHNLNANGGTKMKSGELNRATCEKQFIVNALQHGIVSGFCLSKHRLCNMYSVRLI